MLLRVGQTIGFCRLSIACGSARHDRPRKAMACPTELNSIGANLTRISHTGPDAVAHALVPALVPAEHLHKLWGRPPGLRPTPPSACWRFALC